MEKQISRVEKFVEALSHGELKEKQSVVLSEELDEIGGINRQYCENYLPQACNTTNYNVCVNHEVCDGNADNQSECGNVPITPIPINSDGCLIVP